MAKRSRTKSSTGTTTAPAEGAVGPRQPCPCGSGKRYKACHGDPSGPTAVFVARPFAGLAAEADLVALRELVPAATAPLDVTGVDREVVLATLLPGAAPALVRDSGAVWLGLQVQHQFGDPSRDLAAVLQAALDQAERGETGMVGLTEAPGEGPRLQDLLADTPLDVTVHEGFDYWVADVPDVEPGVTAALEQANASIHPTERLSGTPAGTAAYWVSVGTKEHLRWVMTDDEDALLTALARLHVSGDDVIVPGARLVGMFRAHGVLVPVWDLEVGTGAAVLEEPAARFAEQLAAALADTSPLTPEVRSARAGLANRQVTIR